MKKQNRLAKETSPYLLQHADNPVDWYPWSDEAFERAIKENKPVLLSIGYSTCHWCHVMAHESFEDAKTATLMNNYFINIKVDREERPDLDKIYQLAFQLLMNRGGGWPLTLFLTPNDRMPFFAGTYFPLEAKYNLPSFKDILEQIHTIYYQQNHAIQEQNANLSKVFAQFRTPKQLPDIPLDETLFHRAFNTLEENFDSMYGGFGSAPKFPQATRLQGLLHHAYQDETIKQTAMNMFVKTLAAMSFGGIYDQLAGGFFRYSVDGYWNIPHFEKMLYDNAQLLTIYTDAYAATKEPLFKGIAEETAQWLLHDMRDSNNSFYAAIDADSEGVEGKFYVWEKSDIEKILSTEEFAVFSTLMGLEQPANFESHWHLYIAESDAQIIKTLDLPEQTISKLIANAKSKLLKVRNKRIHPHRDEKILTSWNALTLKAFARAGRILERQDFIDVAADILTFIQKKLFVDDTLYATYQHGKKKIPGFLDDYVFLVDGILELLQARWDTKQFEFALKLLTLIEEKFADPHGSFFFTSNQHEETLFRPKSWMDEALPNSNGIAAQLFFKFGFWLGNQHFIELAENTLKTAPQFVAHPDLHESLLIALEHYLSPPEIVILTGEEKQIVDWKRVLLDCYHPSRMVFYFSPKCKLPASFHYEVNIKGPRAYICKGTTCLDVIENIDAFKNYFIGQSL